MGKQPPEELWHEHTLERFEALKQSGLLKELRREGLAACGRKKRFTATEWFWSPMYQRYSSTIYMEWYRKCEAIAERFGLSSWTVSAVCLISGYQPEEQPFPIEVDWPRIRVVTEQTNPLFLLWLSYEAKSLGLHVIQRRGSVESSLIPPNFQPSEVLAASERPLRDCAFFMRVETPPLYPPQAAINLQNKAKRLEKKLFRQLGYKIPVCVQNKKTEEIVRVSKSEAKKLVDSGEYKYVTKTDWQRQKSEE